MRRDRCSVGRYRCFVRIDQCLSLIHISTLQELWLAVLSEDLGSRQEPVSYTHLDVYKRQVFEMDSL